MLTFANALCAAFSVRSLGAFVGRFPFFLWSHILDEVFGGHVRDSAWTFPTPQGKTFRPGCQMWQEALCSVSPHTLLCDLAEQGHQRVPMAVFCLDLGCCHRNLGRILPLGSPLGWLSLALFLYGIQVEFEPV